MFGEKPTLEPLSEERKACANYTCNVPPTIWLRRCCCCYCLPFPLVYNSFPTANLQNFPMLFFCARSYMCVPSPVRCWPNLIEFGRRRRRRADGNACMYLFRLFIHIICLLLIIIIIIIVTPCQIAFIISTRFPESWHPRQASFLLPLL